MRFVVTLFSLLLITACQATAPVRVPFAIYNNSPHEVRLVVDGKEVGPTIGANGSDNFYVWVEVPSRGTGTEPIDQYVTVTVSVRKTSDDSASPVQTCSAGARRTTSVIYEVTSSFGQTYQRLDCR